MTEDTPETREQKFELLVRNARRVNRERDEVEQSYQFAPPDRAPYGVHCGTAMQAIKTGLMFGDPDFIAEGYAMLEQLKVRLDLIDRFINETARKAAEQERNKHDA